MKLAKVLWIAGGIGLMVARPLVSYSWSGLWGLSYQTYNQLATLPLMLLIPGVVALLRSQSPRLSRGARGGLCTVAFGLGLSLAGIVVEFGIGGGLQGGPRHLAHLGWGIYVAGMAGQLIGLAIYGFSSSRSNVVPGLWRITPLVMAGSILLWPVLMNHWLGTVVQVVYGLGFSLYGAALLQASPQPVGLGSRP